MSVYYPQSALEGFGAAVNAQLGVSVKVANGKPRTDGNTIYLPPITGALNRDEFEGFCGVALHEAAHVAIGSTGPFRKYARQSALHADCFNAVLDVADETRLERTMRRAMVLFAQSNSSAFRTAKQASAFDKGPIHWVVLALGIMLNRPMADRLGHDAYQLAKSHPQYPTIYGAYRILRRARTRRNFKHMKRDSAGFRRLAGLANELVKLLKDNNLEPPASGFPAMVMGGFGASPANGGDPATMMPSDTAGAQPGPGYQMAGHSDGQAVIDGPGASSGAGESRSDQPGFDSHLHSAMVAAISGPVSRMTWSRQADEADDGYLNGSRIGSHIERAAIDGRCFARRNDAEGEKLHAVVLLDKSGSMRQSMGAVSAVAQAFADAIGRVADSVTLATFNSQVAQCTDFRTVMSSGGTRTALALQWADDRLAGQRGRRLVVCITDGSPDDPNAVQQACRQMQTHRIGVIGIAYQMNRECLDQTMPGARIIAATDTTGLACELSRVAAQLAA